MIAAREWISRLWGAVRGNRGDADLQEELELHLKLAAEDLERRSEATHDAIRATRLRAGGVAQAMEALRDQRGLPWLADLAEDVRHGLRTMRRSPLFTTVAVVTLALGIGANTAAFSLVNVLVWRDLPVPDPQRLVQLSFRYPGDPPLSIFSTKHYEQYRDSNSVFSHLIGTRPLTVDTADSEAEPLNTEWVTGNFFQGLGVRPAIGRLLGPDDGEPGSAPVAVVSWIYWKNRFNLDPQILGEQITVADVSARVVGVTRQGFTGLLTGYRTDLWIPAAAHPNSRQASFMLMARLKEGVSIERARAEIRVLDRSRIEELAQNNPTWLEVALDVEPARTGFSTPLHQQFAKPMLVVMAIVAVLLLLTCANLGSMLLARGTARQREMALRVSLGASRFRIVRQVLTESLLLSLLGGLCGVIGAYFGAEMLVRVMTSGTRLVGPAPSLDVPIDASVLMFTAAVAVVAAVLFGLAPAWMVFATQPASTIRVTGSTGPPRSGRLFGNGLVVAQVAISVVLLSVAGLSVQHLSDLRNRDLGFDRTSMLLVKLDRAPTTENREQAVQLYKDALVRFETLSGVRSATLSGMTPISGAAASQFITVDGFEEAPTARRRVSLNQVAPNFFRTFGTPLISGRDFEFSDESRAPVAVVNQAVVRHYFAGRDPIGRHLRLDGGSRSYEVIGVVADAKYNDVRSPAPRTVYLHAFQQRQLPSQFALRTSVSPATIVTDVRHIVEDVLDGASVRKMMTLSEQVDAAIVPERLMATMSGFFGGVGVLLAAIGLYGLLAYTVARRTTEIGIRIALGATRGEVTQMVLKQALSLVCVGLAIATPLALWSEWTAARLLGSLSVESVFPSVIAAIVTIVVALLAAYLPARRATRIEPLAALRSE